ncbi:MAG: hypothetical protein AAF456_20880 [Planctomycetota bacterium]
MGDQLLILPDFFPRSQCATEYGISDLFRIEEQDGRTMESIMPAALIITALVATAGVVALVLYVIRNEREKYNRCKEKIRETADRLNGHYVEYGPWWSLPKIVIDHSGFRFHVDLKRDSPQDSGIKFVSLRVTADGMDPQFNFSVTPLSFGAKAGAWLSGNGVKTGDEEFDSRLLVATNRHRSSINMLLSPMARQSLQFLSTFEPELKSAGKDLKQSAEKRQSEQVVMLNAAKTINRKRFDMKVEAGKAEFNQVIHVSELDILDQNINAMLNVFVDLDENYQTLERTTVVKK